MSEIVGGVIGALALVGIPLATWVARRATREGRLLLRVEVLGRVYGFMPDGEVREVFASHVNAAIAELNAWLNPENRKLRARQRAFSVVTYLFGALIGLVIFPSIPSEVELTTAAGVLVGSLIAAMNIFGSWFIGRRTAREASLVAEAERLEQEARRLDALRRGESFAS